MLTIAHCSLVVVLQTRCHGKYNCSVPASNQYFTDPCSTTFKYLEVEYRCEGGEGKRKRMGMTLEESHKNDWPDPHMALHVYIRPICVQDHAINTITNL